jgi:RNA ligase (TIGR02306 family)
MTDFHVECVRVGKIEKHPNADTLGVTHVGAYPVIVKLGDFREGDLAVYVPVDAVVPSDRPQFSFLDSPRIKARRLRGVFSQGLLVHAPQGCVEGDDCAALLGVRKYETPEESAERNGPRLVGVSGASRRGAEVDPKQLPRYTDLENLKRWPDVLEPGEKVVVMEKLEGENCRVMYARPSWWRRLLGQKGKLVVGSRNQIKESGRWVDVTAPLEGVFARQPDPERYALYGESFGYTKGFKYGDGSPRFRLFDVWDRKEQRWLNWFECLFVAIAFDLEMAPILYIGEWHPEIVKAFAEGKSALDPSHVREGFVVKPLRERTHPRLGRVILKCKGEGYLLRKEAA